jgi:outer membrane lipoprotein-sorting protein
MNALQGARIKDGEEKAAMERASKISPLSSWRDFYTDGKTLGTEDVDGRPAWKIEMTPKQGKPEMFYLDKETMLLVRTTATIPTAMGEIPVDAQMGDYRVVDGIQTPFTMTQKAMSQTMVMHFDKVQYNAPIPPGRFDLPPAVKAIAAKQ